MKNTAKYYGA